MKVFCKLGLGGPGFLERKNSSVHQGQWTKKGISHKNMCFTFLKKKSPDFQQPMSKPLDWICQTPTQPPKSKCLACYVGRQ